MRKIELEVYKYEELEEEVKEVVREKISELIVDLRFDWLKEDLQEILACEYDLHDCELRYSLSYCQGDGLSFDCDNLLESSYIMNKIKEKLNKNEKAMLTSMIKKYQLSKIVSHNTNNHYCYASEYDIDIKLGYGWYDLTKKQQELIDKIQNIVVEVYLEICSKLECEGYNCYNVSEEDIVDMIKGNEWEFYEDGEMV